MSPSLIPLKPSGKSRRGFTLIEILMTVAMLSTLVGVALFATTSLTTTTSETKLTRDVTVLNKALRQYEMAGGSLAGVIDAQAVVNKLKTVTTGDNRKSIAGLKGAMVDPRLMVLEQAEAEFPAAVPRARYHATKRRFEIISTGPGIRSFVLNEQMATTDFGTETRSTTLQLAKRDQWVWDYQDNTQSGSGATAPIIVTSTPAVSLSAPVDKILIGLASPTFSRDPGTYALRNYPLPVSLIDPNPANTADLQWSQDGGTWGSYQNARILEPGTAVSAYARPLDPDNYDASAVVTANYQTTPETPLLRLAFPDTNLSYKDLGGPMLPSCTGAVPPNGTLSLTNAVDFPTVYQNNGVFQPAWTLDGSDPLSSSTVEQSPAFNNGYPGDVIPVDLVSWPVSHNTRTIRAAVRTLRPALVNPSAVQQVSLTRQIITLPAPLISFGSRDCTIALNTSTNEIPVGARIFFTTNGTDPGNNAGEPVTGTLYTGPFLAESLTNNAEVVARVYPPVDWKVWFNPSGSASLDPPSGGTGGYIGGDFAVSGAAGRGVARLLADGSVDSSFNPGAGINGGSRVQALAATGTSVIIGGDFTTVAGVNRVALARLGANGALDTSFSPSIQDSPASTSFTLDFASLGLQQNAALSGADTRSNSSPDATHGLSTAGGFSGFGAQTFNNVGGSGINMTLYYSQNMSEGMGNAVVHNGPDLHGTSGSAGANPDRRVTGASPLRLTNDRSGTLTPATVGMSFSEPVFFDSIIVGHLSGTDSAAEHGLFRAFSGANASGSLVAASTAQNFSAENGPLLGTSADPVMTNATGNLEFSTPSSGVYLASGSGSETENRYGRARFAYTSNPVQSLALSNWTTATTSAVDPSYHPSKAFGVAQDYSIFAYGNIELVSGGGSTVGGVAAGGNLKYGYNGGFYIGGLPGRDGLVVQGRLDTNGNGSVNKGNVAYGSTPNATLINVWQGTKRQATNVIDFPGVKASHLALSSHWKSLPNTGGGSSITYGTPGGDGKVPIILNAGKLHGTVVFNMDATKLVNVAYWNIVNVSPSATILINIPGTTPTLQNFYIGNDGTAGNTLFHFPDATTATFSSVGIPGTVFVPKGLVSLGSNGSQIGGQIIADRMDLRSFHDGGANIFTGKLPAGESSGDPAINAGDGSVTFSLSGFRRTTAQPGKVWAVTPQSDRKILIGGRFQSINGTNRKNIARLNADGTLDSSFDPGSGPDGEVWSIHVRVDGSVVVGGQFDSWSGASGTSRVVVLRANGSRDNGFLSPVSTGGTDIVRWVGSDSNNRIYIGGRFSSPAGGFARLTPAGAVDASFAIGSGAGSGNVYSASVRPDGSVLVAGDFTSFNGTARNRIALLTSGGAVSQAWSPGTGFNGPVIALSRRGASESLLTGGAFSQHLGKTRSSVSVINMAAPATAATMWGPTNLSINAIYTVD